MKTSEDLRQLLDRIDHRGYPAYKDTKGMYQFARYVLSIEHVQGDPFAAPSKLSVCVAGRMAGFPRELFDKKHKRIALQDELARNFWNQIQQYSFQAKGSGKSGIISVSRCSQEILERTACELNPLSGDVTVRFEVGFPANGRTINARELKKILYDFLPSCVERSLYYARLDGRKVQKVMELSEDQAYIRSQLETMGLVAFVANGAILPRESGVSQRPMKGAVPFCSPKSMEVAMELPYRGKISGMGIPRGVTLIVGGGYHGKSTLLKALETGVYPHIAGDGREYVVTDAAAMKIRAEDGRSIRHTDISMFINDLPNKKNTKNFSTPDASGSTSQAAAVIESWESGSRVFLIDEDTSATNFMLRDELMQQIISRDKEPITPFIERARDLYEKAGISTIMVAGSSGAYFYIADTIIQMDCYRPVDITAATKEACKRFGEDPTTHAPNFVLPERGRRLHVEKAGSGAGNSFNRGGYRGGHEREERIKTKVHGKDSLQVGKEQVDLRFVEQLIHNEQTAALAQMVRYCISNQLFARYSVEQIADLLWNQIQQKGLPSISDSSYAAMGLCLPRRQEIFACLNRYRG